MKEDYIEVSIDSPSPIDFSNGDYIIYDYNGIKYTLSDPIGVKKQARKDTYSKAFVYTGIKFNSNFNLLFRCMFLDIVQEDNLNHYTSLPDVDTFEDVYGIAGRIQANLDNQYPNTFNIKIVDTTGNAELESILRTARAFNVSNGYCSDALSTIYDQWGVGYIYTVENGKDTIIIGGTAGESTVFRYGKNNGLRVITSDIQNLSELCNRIFPFGSTRNLPARWYNKKQYIQDLQYAPNLLIPKSKWGDNNPRSAFVENTESINKYGLRPKAIYWDGSDSDRIEVYPSIEGVTAGIIRQAKAEAEDTTYVPSTELYPDNELVDEILVGDNIEDDGLNIDTGYKLYSEQYAYAYNAEEGKDFQTNKIGTIGKDGAELGFAFTFEMPNNLTPFTLPKDAVYRIGSPDHELEVIGYNTLPYLYIPRTYAKSYATYLFSQNHPAYLVGRAEGTNDFWRWECSIEESDEGFTIRPIAEQTISLRAGSSLFFSFEVSASILFSDSYAIEHLNEEIFATCYIRGGGFYIQRGLNYIFQDFNIYIKQIGFNIADYPSEDNNYITININTGSCAGRSFKIRKVEYDSALDRWKLNCYRSDDNTLSLRFPNSDFHISAGDKFVITNIQMPDLYVYIAMEKLYNEALKELDLLSHPSRIYTPEIDNLQMARSPQVLRAGMFMPISDDDLNIQSDNAILIDSIEVSEGENAIRTFSVTLRNEKQDNILKKNKKGIKSISVALKKSKSEASRVSSNESVNQDSTGVTGGGTSVSSYDNLTNKPSINDVELKGNLTSEDLGLQPKGEYVIESDFNKHTNNKDIHISSEEREKWNNKSDLTEDNVKEIKVNNAGHADSADNATKAGSADKLTNSHKIFGLPFDGTKDVDGGITANGDSVINGNLNVTKDGIFGGEVSGIVGEGTPVGVTDYSALTGKPSINGKELASGDNTLDALGIQPKGDYTTASQLASTLEDYATKVYVSNNFASKGVVNAIQALIPATATADNQLADKDFVNSSIATATAEFRGSFTSLDELKATSGNLNDYAFYLHNDSVGNSIVDRYKWTTAGWLYEYTLNNSSFTAEQWAALNSAITATLVQSYNSHLSNSIIHITAAERTKWNNKWDYNEETIQGVKVNAAVSADQLTSDAGTSAIPIYFDGGIPVQCTPSALFYGFANGYDASAGGRVLGITIAGYTRKVVVAYSTLAGSADTLATVRKIWGRPFDGSADVSGDLINVGNITASGKATIQGDIVCGGEVVAIAGEGTPVGVTDYSALTGKPAINGVTLVSGNNTLAALGIQAAGDYATNSGVATLLADYATKTFVSNNYAGKAAFNSHTADSDIHITSAERTAWNSKWDYNENTIKAVKVTSASSADSVTWSGISGKPTTFTPSAHTHTASDISGLPTKLSAFTNDVGYVSVRHKNGYSYNNLYTLYQPGTSSIYRIDLTSVQVSIWAMLFIEVSLRQNYSPGYAGKILINAYHDTTNTFREFNATILGTLQNINIYGSDGRYIYINASMSHSTISIDRVLVGDTATTADLSNITIERVNSLPDTYQTAAICNGLHTGNFTKSLVEGVLTGNITSHTHSYLPLDGGTLNRNSTIGFRAYSAYDGGGGWNVSVLNLYDSEISKRFGGLGYFGENLDLVYIYLGVENHNGNNLRIYGTGTNDIKWGDNPILHSGNYNSYVPTLTGTGASGTWGINISGNAATATNADLLDEYHISDIGPYIFGSTAARFLDKSIDLNDATVNSHGGWWSSYDNTGYANAPTDNFGLLVARINTVYTAQLILQYGGSLMYRSQYYASSGILWTSWKTIAFTDSNVASATKLATARTLWGQPFDGTSDVNGDAHITGDLIVDGEVSALVA